MKTKYFLSSWLVTFAVSFILNGLFHGLIAADFFDNHLTGLGNSAVKMKDFNPLPIIVLELSLDLCLVVIITRLRNERIIKKEAILLGGLFYLSTALSWNLANSATLVSWPLIVTAADSCWHFVTGLLAGWIIYKLCNRNLVTTPAERER